MAIVLNTGFSIGSKDLIYDKFVLTKDEMLNIHENTYPDQFFALCSDNDSLYVFNVNNTPNTETGKFVQYSSGTGEDVDLAGLFMTSAEITTMLDDVFSGTSEAIYTAVDADGYTLVDSEGYEIIIA